jgi:transcription elongation factor GreA
MIRKKPAFKNLPHLNPPPIPKIPFTSEAYQKLKLDLERLTKEQTEVMKRLQIAREMGDLSENGAYIYAKFELGSVRRQIRQLQHLLTNGEVVEKSANSDSVDFGCAVTLVHNDKEVTYTIVSIHESNLKEHKLSTESPIGKAIMGKRVGDTVQVQVPAGEVVYTIKKID